MNFDPSLYIPGDPGWNGRYDPLDDLPPAYAFNRFYRKPARSL